MRAVIRQVLFSQPPFSPRRLFAAGEQGVWYDPSDFSTLFQDSAGTTPVTAVGQPVGLILDKSGRGNHASQSTTTSRPILRQEAGGQYYLEFDGSDDSLQTGNINFSATDKMSIFAGMYWGSLSNIGMLAELSVASSAVDGTFYCYFHKDYGPPRIGITGTASSKSFYATSVITPLTLYAMSQNMDLSTANVDLRLNGSNAGLTTSGTTSPGNFAAAQALYIGRRGGTSLPFAGRIYSLIIRGALTNSPQLEQTERWVAAKTGVTL